MDSRVFGWFLFEEKENEITCVSSCCLLTKNIFHKEIILTIKTLKIRHTHGTCRVYVENDLFFGTL